MECASAVFRDTSFRRWMDGLAPELGVTLQLDPRKRLAPLNGFSEISFCVGVGEGEGGQDCVSP